MQARSLSPTLLLVPLLLAALRPAIAEAQEPRDSLVQAPTFKQPERGSLVGGLAKFSISAEEASRGSYALALPIEVPAERGQLLAEVLPSYGPENGISEWGIGWSVALAIRRFRLVGDVDYQTDGFTSPWGRLERGTDGAYYLAGLRRAIRFQPSAAGWTATDSSGTRYEFRHPVNTPEGVYAWYLTRAETLFGDAAEVEYVTSAGGRPFVSRVHYGGREDPRTYRLDFEHELLPAPLLDFQSGHPLALDRRVSGVVAWAKEGGRGAHRRRWRHDITYRDSAFGPGFHLDSVLRTFASGETEPPISYDYDHQEQATPAGLAFATGDLESAPGLQDYLAATDDPDALQPGHAAVVDVDEDGLPDLEHGFDFTLFRQSASGGFVAEPLGPPPAGADPHCRPPEAIGDRARTLVRMAGPGTDLQVLVLEPQSATTDIRVCNRAGEQQFSTEVPGLWSLGANMKIVDLNRDDRPDLLLVDSGQVEVLENISGDGCTPGSGQTCVRFGFRAHPPADLTYVHGFPFLPSATWSHDMNGDGNADLVQRSDDRISIWHGRGRFRFDGAETRFALLNRDGDELFNLDDWEIAWVDANKDGLTDALMSIGQESSLFINEGDHFQEVVSPALDDAGLLRLGVPAVGDFRGRGDLDLVFASDASAIALTQPSSGLLVGADDGKGTAVAFDYGRAAAAPGLRQRPSVLRSLTTASAGRDQVTYRYAYGAPRTHSVGHFLVGFATVEAAAPKTRTVVDFHHDDDIAALVETSRSFDDRTPGLMKFSHTAHEEAAHAGVRLRRDRTTWSGWCGGSDASACIAGTVAGAIEVSENTAYERGICPTRARRNDNHGRLEIETALAAPSVLAGALHCLPASQVWIGAHAADPARDFRLETRVARNGLGQVTRVDQLGGSESLTLQEVSYDPTSHRVMSVSAPGQGAQLFSYDPDTGHLERATSADGVVAHARGRDPLTDALLELVGDRGPGGVLVSSFRYDGMERLGTTWSDFGGSSAARPLQSIDYQFATGDFPALVRVDSLLDAATGARQESAAWSYPDGAELARASRIPGRWIFDRVWTVDRNELRTSAHRRPPLLDGAEIASETYGSLLAGTVQLSENLVAGFGHRIDARSVVQQGVERQFATTLSVAGGLLVATSRENGALETRSATDARGLTTWVSDQLGHITRYEYDSLGRLVEVILPDGARQRLSFDSFGRPARVTRSGIGTITYSYAPATGLLRRKEYRDTAGALERRLELAYDAAGRVVERAHLQPASGEERRFALRYDGDDGSGGILPGQRGYTTRVDGPAYTAITVYNPDGSEARSSVRLADWMQVDVSSTYHVSRALKEARRVITRLSDGAIIEDLLTRHVYDAWGRLERIAIDGQDLATIHYDDDGRLAWIDIAGGQRIDHAYDPVTYRQSGYSQRMAGDAGPWTAAVDWDLDRRGFVAREVIDLADESWQRDYEYDPRGFLVSAEDDDQLSTYAYTAPGHPAEIDDQRGSRRIARAARTTASIAGTPYVYDASGRVVSRGGAAFTYGPDGQLSAAQIGGRTLTYDYDADGNRLVKYEAGVPVAAYLDGGYLTSDGFIGPVEIAGRVVGILESGTFHLLATDPRGTLLADRDGSPRLASPYGARTTRPDLSAALDYVEKAYDPDLDTVRMGVRDYDPLLGQFWTPDPLYLEAIDRCARSPVDCNLYSYARNNPISFVDPTGTDPVPSGSDAEGLPNCPAPPMSGSHAASDQALHLFHTLVPVAHLAAPVAMSGGKLLKGMSGFEKIGKQLESKGKVATAGLAIFHWTAWAYSEPNTDENAEHAGGAVVNTLILISPPVIGLILAGLELIVPDFNKEVGRPITQKQIQEAAAKYEARWNRVADGLDAANGKIDMILQAEGPNVSRPDPMDATEIAPMYGPALPVYGPELPPLYGPEAPPPVSGPTSRPDPSDD